LKPAFRKGLRVFRCSGFVGKTRSISHFITHEAKK